MQTTTSYRELLADIRNRGEYVVLPRRLCREIGVAAGALLMHLIGVAQVKADQGGWIMATDRFLGQGGLGISADRLDSIFERLRRTGLVEVEWRGRIRFVRVESDGVRRLMGV